MKNIIKNSKESIFRDKSKGGLLVHFTIAYNKETNTVLDINCPLCFNQAYKRMELKYKKKMETNVKCDWKLHEKYNGINIGTNGDPIRNGEMTNDVAKELHDWHPNGDSLFEIMPTHNVTVKQREEEEKKKIAKDLSDRKKEQAKKKKIAKDLANRKPKKKRKRKTK